MGEELPKWSSPQLTINGRPAFLVNNVTITTEEDHVATKESGWESPQKGYSFTASVDIDAINGDILRLMGYKSAKRLRRQQLQIHNRRSGLRYYLNKLKKRIRQN